MAAPTPERETRAVKLIRDYLDEKDFRVNLKSRCERLESEKSLLEKRVRELETEDPWKHVKLFSDRIEALETENERLKAGVDRVKAHCDSPGKFINRQDKQIAELESRLAEAVRIMRETLNSFCECLDGSGKVETSDEFGNTEIYRCPCSKARDFLNSPTTSKALEIARARDAVIEATKNHRCSCYVGEITGTRQKVVNTLEALDALTSEEGKV